MQVLRAALVGATFLVAASAAASAADVYDRKGGFKDASEAYMPPITWGGFYAGVHAGSTFDDTFTLTDGDNSLTGEADNAFVGGIHVGYNWQKSTNWVFGLEAAVSLLDDGEEDIEITDYLASVRGRLGYATGSSLFYGTGGVAFLGYSDDVAEILDEDTAVGFVVGAGFEHKLTNNISFGVEGLYYDFASETIEPGIDLERDLWTIQARLSYHFNRGHDEALK